MLLEIDDNKSLGEIQEKFTESFPYLKIEFYKEAHKWRQASRPAHRYDAYLPVGAVRKVHDPGILEVMSWEKTGELEKKFKKRFGLNVQVFRRHGSDWVQTSGSDGLTLRQQSDKARASVISLREKEGPGDEEVYYEVQ